MVTPKTEEQADQAEQAGTADQAEQAGTADQAEQAGTAPRQGPHMPQGPQVPHEPKMPYRHYRSAVPLVLADRTWPNRQTTAAPRWVSVDLRDGNQARVDPMDP